MKTSKQTRWGLFADSCTSQPVHKPRVVWTNFILLPRVTLFVALFVIPLVLVGLGVFGTPTANATAGINQDLSFQGKIVNSSGTNITDGTYNMEFKIYSGCTNEPTNNTGCTLVWTEDDLVSNSDGVSFTSGTYQVNLGQYCPFSGGACTPSNANDGNTNSGVNWDTYPLYLSLQIGSTSSCSPSGNDFQTACTGDGEMDPYILLTSTPYSMNSNEVGGDTLSQLGVLAANQTWTGTNTFEIGSTNALTIQNASGYNELNENTTGNTLTLGNVTSTAGHGVAGNLALADGSTDNYSVTVDTATLSNSYTLSIPATGASGAQCLESSSGSTTSASTLLFSFCGAASYINNSTTAQSANLNVQAATSGTVAGKFEANASGSGDILDLLNGSGTTVVSFSDTGAAALSASSGTALTVNGTTDLDTSSSTALVVQNSSYNTLTVNTSSDQVILGSGTGGESSPSLLVLDSGTNSTDPTEVNGALYYNSSMNMFRCGENGAWVDCVGGILGTNSAAGSAIDNCTTACGALASAAIPANYCQAGRTLTIYASGVWSTSSATSLSYVLQFYYGTSSSKASDTAIGAATPSYSTGTTYSLASVPWTLNYTFICYSTSSWDGEGTFTFANTTTSTTTSDVLGTGNTDTTSVPTTAFNLYLFPTWGTGASASYSTTVDQWIVKGN